MAKKKKQAAPTPPRPVTPLKDLLEARFKMPEKIRSSRPLDAFQQIRDRMETLIRKDSGIRDYVREHVAKKLFPEVPVEELLRYLALRSGMVPKDDPETTYSFLKDFVQPRMQFEREQLKKAVEMLVDLSASERAILSQSHDLGELFDRFYLDWYKAQVAPMLLALRMKKGPAHRDEVADAFREQGLDNPYTVITGPSGEFLEKEYDLAAASRYTQRSLGELFPHTLNRISDALDAIRWGLANDATHFQDYFGCLPRRRSSCPERNRQGPDARRRCRQESGQTARGGRSSRCR